MAKDYMGKWYTRVQAAPAAVTVSGSGKFWGRAPVSSRTVFIGATGVKSDSVISVTLESAVTSVAAPNSYFAAPSFFVTSVQEDVGFCLSTVTSASDVTSYTAHWVIANPA